MTKRTLGTRASRDLIQQLRDAAGLPKQFDESQVEKELSFMVAILCTSEIDNIDLDYKDFLIEVLLELENFLQSDASPDEKKDQKILAAGQHLLYATGGIGEMLSDEDGNLINFEAHPCERTEGQIHVEFRAILIAREKKFYKYHFVHWLKAIVEAGLIDNGNAPIEIERAFVLRHYGLCNDSEAEIKMAEKIMADKLPSEIVKKWIN